LGKVKVKHISVVFLNLMTLRVAICILGTIANIARTKDDGPITLLSTTITEVETSIAPVLDKSGKAELPRFLVKAKAGGEWESIKMRVTAYCPCRKCCGKYSDGVTACGHEIQPGDTFVAADRRYPFGTEMLIPATATASLYKFSTEAMPSKETGSTCFSPLIKRPSNGASNILRSR